jgi:hypothetical protein
MLNRRGFFASAGAVAVTGAAMALPQLAQAESTGKAGSLTEESLGKLLTSMGIKTEKSEQRYDFDFNALIGEEEWALSMSAVLSQDASTLWIMAWLDELPKAAADVPRTALLRLLSLNDTMGNGKFFAYININRRFVLQRVIANEKLESASVREILKDLGKTVVDTYPVWSVENWSGNHPAAPTASATNQQTIAAPVSTSTKK